MKEFLRKTFLNRNTLKFLQYIGNVIIFIKSPALMDNRQWIHLFCLLYPVAVAFYFVAEYVGNQI